MSEIIIRTTNLQKRYHKTTALHNLSFEIAENSITGLIGRNGSGKTTLMKILSGQLNITEGEATVLSESPMDHIPVLQNIIYSYHNFPYHKNLNLSTILQNYQGMFPNFDIVFANRLMKYFELKPGMKYKSLSQGMGSIFNFLTALSCRCKLTMLDEPVLGMDITVRRAAYDILMRDYMENPRTFIISSHLFNELEGVLSDVLLIDQGNILLHDNVDRIRNSAYRIDGEIETIKKLCKNKTVIECQNRPLQSYAILYEPITDQIQRECMKFGVTLSSVSVEDLYIYLTKQKKEEELTCLW